MSCAAAAPPGSWSAPPSPPRPPRCWAASGCRTSRPASTRRARSSAGSCRRRSAPSWCTPESRSPDWPPRGRAWRTCSSSSPARASMSTADVTDPAAEITSARREPAPLPGHPAAPVIHWIRFLSSELRLIFLRWRNLALLAVLAALPVLIGVAVKLSTRGGGGNGGGPAFIGQVAGNGVFLGLASLTVLLTLVLPLVIAV